MQLLMGQSRSKPDRDQVAGMRGSESAIVSWAGRTAAVWHERVDTPDHEDIGMLRAPTVDWVDTLRLPDGRAVIIRAARPGDEPLIQAFVHGLSMHSRYQRFFLPLHEMLPDHLERLTHADPQSDMALLAFEWTGAGTGAIAGIVEYGSQPGSDTCELAVVVGEHWRRQGLALRLMQDIAQIAIANGFAQAAVEVLRDNPPAQELARRIGATPVVGAAPSPGGAVRLTASLRTAASNRSTLGHLVRLHPITTLGPS